MAQTTLSQGVFHNVSTTKVAQNLSYLEGNTDEPLWDITLSQLLLREARAGPTRQCLVFPQLNYRITYGELYQRTLQVAKGLLWAGIKKGDHVGIMAGNVPAYVELLFAASHIGASFVVLNNTYTPTEVASALRHSECKILFTVSSFGGLSNSAVLDTLLNETSRGTINTLENVVLLKSKGYPARRFQTYDTFVEKGDAVRDLQLTASMQLVSPSDVCNMQFTSGTTGSPKAAMLTHNNIVNNGRFVGDRMRLTPSDIICCPPPLFHCFGLVLGLLAVISHGSSIVFPSEVFDPAAVLRAVSDERCTGLHGVPAMFSAQLELVKDNFHCPHLRTGIAAGAPVPKKLMEDLRAILNLHEITNTYGMTETSPASFMTFTDDPIEKRLATVGRILPHTKAKIIDKNGHTVQSGLRGEICVAGFSLQKGYYKNPGKTEEVMRKDQDGILWMHTGDEGLFDEDGYCVITGRIKDVIIRGGENIYPLEIEERLVQHPAIVQASVIGLPSHKYSEEVAAVLQHRHKESKPSLEEVRSFVRDTLGWHKAPVHVFWLDRTEDFPKTGSGKIKKHELRDRYARLVGSVPLKAKL